MTDLPPPPSISNIPTRQNNATFSQKEEPSTIRGSMLFECYVEYNRLDTAEVNACFKQLDELLCALSPVEAEMVIDTACDLCRKHEKSAFLLGVQLGIRLAQEAKIH